MNIYSIFERDRLLNPRRVPRSDEAQAVVAEVIQQLNHYEDHLRMIGSKHARKRARRRADRATFERAASALVCDLMHRALTSDEEGRIAVSLDTSIKRTRYNRDDPTSTKVFPRIVRMLASPELEFAEVVEPGDWQIGRRTAIKAGNRLLNRLNVAGVDPEDFGHSREDEEIVILKSAKADPENAVKDRSEWVEYTDNRKTKSFRREVRIINTYLADALIHYSDDALGVDPSDRHLRRYFNNQKFDQGGRLFGGFWQQLKKKQRRLITIDGQEARVLDYKTMMPTLAYAHLGAVMPEGDAYTDNRFQRERPGIKKLMAAMLFAQRPLKRWPGHGEVIKHFDANHTSLSDAVNSIKGRHPALVDLWFTGIGHHLHFVESEIMVNVLLDCFAKGITALPVHDAIVVGSQVKEQATEIMEQVFENATGIKPTIHLER